MNRAIEEQVRFVLDDDNELMRAAIEKGSDLSAENKQRNRELIQKHEQILAKLDSGEVLSQEDLQLVRDANEVHVNDAIDLGGRHKEALALDKWLDNMSELSMEEARKILADIGAPATEVFPKQDALTDGVSYGNFINAPLFGALVPKGRTVFVDPAEPTRVYPDQWQLLERVRRHTEKDLDTVIGRCHWETRHRPRAGHCAKAEPEVPAFGLLPCARKILAEGVSAYQRVSCFRLAVHLKRNGLPYDLALAVLKAWAKKNRPADGRRIITEREIEYQTRCAFDRSYRSFGCEQAAMVAYCHRECPLYPYIVSRRLGRGGPCGEDRRGE